MLSCPCCGVQGMDDEFMEEIDHLRHISQIPFIVTSGYRCPDYNNRIAKSGKSGPHTTGKAIDISLYGNKAWIVLSNALEMGFSGVGVYQSGDFKGRFLHLDQVENSGKIKRPNLWSG